MVLLTALPALTKTEDLVTDIGDELSLFIVWITQTTGFKVISDAALGLVGVEIDQESYEIRVNDCLDPASRCCALARACRRILRGPDAAPEFRAKLRPVR